MEKIKNRIEKIKTITPKNFLFVCPKFFIISITARNATKQAINEPIRYTDIPVLEDPNLPNIGPIIN